MTDIPISDGTAAAPDTVAQSGVDAHAVPARLRDLMLAVGCVLAIAMVFVVMPAQAGVETDELRPVLHLSQRP